MPTTPRRARRSLLPVLLGAAVALAACSPDAPAQDPTVSAPSTGSGSAPTAPEATASPGGAAPVPALHPSVDGYPETLLTITSSDGATRRLPVKVARTRDQQIHGLMEVEEVPDGTGMWFVFDEPRSSGFWMFQTLVPLSIAYVDADGAIVDILAMEPCPPEAGRDCPSYPPDGSYVAALEVRQGWFADEGVAVGDTIVAATDPAGGA